MFFLDKFMKKLLRKTEKEAEEFRLRFRTRFKKEIITAILAAFGFLIALSWREPIVAFVDKIIASLNLGVSGEIFMKILSAVIVTIIAVFVFVLIARWEAKDEE